MAEKFPEGHDMMSEEYQKYSDSKDKDREPGTCLPFCDPCQDDGNQTTAAGFCVDCNDYLCTECYNIHKRARPSRNHVLRDKDNLPATKPNSESSVEKCPQHQTESVKWICGSHDQVICDICKKIDHRQCKDIKALSDISRNILQSEELTEIESQFSQLQTAFQDNKRMVMDNGNLVDSCYLELIESVTRHASEIRDKDQEMIRTLNLTCDTSNSTIGSLQAELDTCKQKGEAQETFMVLRKLRSQLSVLQERLKFVERDNKINIYKYQPEAMPSDILGKIVIIPNKDDEITAETCTNSEKPISPVKVEDINVKTSSDRNNCWIRGIERLSDNILAIADKNNKKVKIVEITSKTVTTEVQLDVRPWDLTKVDERRMAVTTYEYKQILMMSVSDMLTVQKTINKTEFGYCQGVVFCNNTLFVSYHNPDKIEVLNLDGRVIRNIESKDKDGTVRFGDIEYITLGSDTKTLYLSDRSYKKILSMTLDGEILASFTRDELSYPRGITVSKDGRVFVCSYSSHKIFELSDDLSEGRVILDKDNHGMNYPHSIMYDDKERKLYVGYNNNKKIDVFLV